MANETIRGVGGRGGGPFLPFVFLWKPQTVDVKVCSGCTLRAGRPSGACRTQVSPYGRGPPVTCMSACHTPAQRARWGAGPDEKGAGGEWLQFRGGDRWLACLGSVQMVWTLRGKVACVCV